MAAAAAASFPPPASPSGLRRAAPLSSRNRGGEGTTPSFRHIGIIRSNTRAMLPRRPSHLAWPGMPGTVLFLRENRRGEEGWGKEGRKEGRKRFGKGKEGGGGVGGLAERRGGNRLSVFWYRYASRESCLHLHQFTSYIVTHTYKLQCSTTITSTCVHVLIFFTSHRITTRAGRSCHSCTSNVVGTQR